MSKHDQNDGLCRMSKEIETVIDGHAARYIDGCVGYVKELDCKRKQGRLSQQNVKNRWFQYTGW